MQAALALFIATCCCVAARPAISNEANVQPPLTDDALNRQPSPFIQPLFINDERGVPRMLARPVGFIPIFMFPSTPSKRLPSQQQQLNVAESPKSGTPRNLNLESQAPNQENIQNPPVNLNQEPLYPSLSQPLELAMENKEDAMLGKMDQPIPSSLTAQDDSSLLPSLSDTEKGQSIQTIALQQADPMMAKKQPLPQSELPNAELPAQSEDVSSRSKRQYPDPYYRRRPYFYNNYYQGYPYGYDSYYDDWSGSDSDYDVGIDVEIHGGYPRFF